jgi:hypothetical protein
VPSPQDGGKGDGVGPAHGDARALSADLNGDLWTINNNNGWAWLTRDTSISPGAEPPAENRLAVEVRPDRTPVVAAKLNDRLPADTAKVWAGAGVDFRHRAGAHPPAKPPGASLGGGAAPY